MFIENVIIVNEGKCFRASVLIEEGRIKEIRREPQSASLEGEELGRESAFLLPGIIDGHVHMREPGLTHKATMESETRAAARGGVTTVFDMPNVVPQTTSLQLLQERYAMAEGKCHVNYGFYLGATNDNIEDIKRLDPTSCPGVKLFMGSSTGGMLVDREEQLRRIFRESPALIMAHCEDTKRINSLTLAFSKREGALSERSESSGCSESSEYSDNSENSERPAPFPPLLEGSGEALPVRFHPLIRDHEACYASSSLAVRLAREEGARLHVAHISTARELELFSPESDSITAEACVPHLLFSDEDYTALGARIKCNPAIKTKADREALRRALTDGRIRTVATDHAPHLLSEKQGGALKAMSGMPMVQFSLPAMLGLVDEGVLSIERLVELMCHNPARLYNIKERGFIREGCWADLVLVRRHPWTVTTDCIESLCGWSPLEGRTLGWQVEKTWVNGRLVWDGHAVEVAPTGKRVLFGS